MRTMHHDRGTIWAEGGTVRFVAAHVAAYEQTRPAPEPVTSVYVGRFVFDVDGVTVAEFEACLREALGQ